jgi:hypothetical protein
MEDSELVETVLEMIGNGTLFFDQAHKLCHASHLGQHRHGAEAVQRFAQLGAGGRCPQNIERDAHRWLNTMMDIKVAPNNIILYLQNDWKLGASYEEVPVLSVHEMFAAIWEAGNIQRTLSLFGPGGPSGLKSFWENARRNLDWVRFHPALHNKTLEEMAAIFPLLFFIDGVEVYSNNEFIAFCTSEVENSPIPFFQNYVYVFLC